MEWPTNPVGVDGELIGRFTWIAETAPESEPAWTTNIVLMVASLADYRLIAEGSRTTEAMRASLEELVRTRMNEGFLIESLVEALNRNFDAFADIGTYTARVQRSVDNLESLRDDINRRRARFPAMSDDESFELVVSELANSPLTKLPTADDVSQRWISTEHWRNLVAQALPPEFISDWGEVKSFGP